MQKVVHPFSYYPPVMSGHWSLGIFLYIPLLIVNDSRKRHYTKDPPVTNQHMKRTGGNPRRVVLVMTVCTRSGLSHPTGVLPGLTCCARRVVSLLGPGRLVSRDIRSQLHPGRVLHTSHSRFSSLHRTRFPHLSPGLHRSTEYLKKLQKTVLACSWPICGILT